MKGVVFTSFMDMIEEQYGFDMVDYLIEESNIPSKGAYTSVGTYHHSEMISLLQTLSEKIRVGIPGLLKIYGVYLFGKLMSGYPQMTQNFKNSKDLFLNLDGVIHVEVRKLYPDAELPRFNAVEKSDSCLEMHYYSERHLQDLAEGLLQGALNHFHENATITRTQKAESVVFTICYK